MSATAVGGGAAATAEHPAERRGAAFVLKYVTAGTVFAFVLVKSEAVSWYRMQEMFRFQGFHMFGLFATAITVGIVSIWLVRRLNVRSLDGEPVRVESKAPARYSYILGGLTFGVGWGLTGSCPGPFLALLGAGVLPMVVVLASAVAGTWAYGALRARLPH